MQQDVGKAVASIFDVNVYVIAEPAGSEAVQVTKYDAGGRCQANLAFVVTCDARLLQCIVLCFHRRWEHAACPMVACEERPFQIGHT